MEGIPGLNDSKVSADGVHQHWENTKLLLTTDYDKPVSSGMSHKLDFLDVSARTRCLAVVVPSGQFLFFPVSYQLSSNKTRTPPPVSVGRACYCSKLELNAAAYSVPPNNIYFLLSSQSYL